MPPLRSLPDPRPVPAPVACPQEAQPALEGHALTLAASGEGRRGIRAGWADPALLRGPPFSLINLSRSPAWKRVSCDRHGLGFLCESESGFPQAVSDSVMGSISGLRSLPESWPPCRQTPSSESHQQRVCGGLCGQALEEQACASAWGSRRGHSRSRWASRTASELQISNACSSSGM